MLPEKMVQARLDLVAGKYTQEPNLVLVPEGVKTFPVTVEWSMQTPDSYVIGSATPDHAHRWCVLDGDLKQVMQGTAKGNHRVSKKTESIVSRTLHGGGAHNPRPITFEFVAAKLRNGAAYLLIASRHGLVAAGEFVAVRRPAAKAVAKKKPRAKKAKASKGKGTAAKAKKGAKKATSRVKRAAKKKSAA